MTDLNIDKWVPEGYEFVRLDTQVKIGEYWLSGADSVERITAMDTTMFVPVLVLKKAKWRAEEGSQYWYLDRTLKPVMGHDLGTELDDRLFNIGNYFETQAECLASAELLIKELMK